MESQCFYRPPQEIKNCGEEGLLGLYHKNWTEYHQGSIYLNQLYGYLNAQHIKKKKFTDADINYGGFGHLDLSEQMLEIGELSLDTWKNSMIMPLKDMLLCIILKQIQLDRNSQTVNEVVLHGVINSFVDVEKYKKKDPLKLYQEIFQKPFLKETGEHYRQEAMTLLQECNCSEYMQKVIQRLDSENMRSRRFLHSSSYELVTRECQQRMVGDLLQMLYAECHDMVKKERSKDLSNMYRLLYPIENGLDRLIHEVQEHIKQVGLDTVKNLKGDNIPAHFVESMLEVHVKYTALIQSVFNGDQKFIGALDRACATAINYKVNPKQMCKSPELLAKYSDALLKKSAKGMSESEIDDKLTNSITVFKYLDDKDIYQRFYARMLARRFIYSQSQSMDAEEAMINRLKQACGYEFTNKLHRMFTDMNISDELQKTFTDYTAKNKIDLGINFAILVLQAGAWPIGQSNLPNFALPQELEKSVRTFELFYNEKFNGRKLTWMHSFCNAELSINYLKKPYFVTVSTFHMGILLPFNGSDQLTAKFLMECTRLQEKELLKHVQVLLDAKILTTEDTALSEASVFSLNKQYTNKRTKFKITATVTKEMTQEIEQTQNQVDEHRKMFLQAAVVRIMKARKKLNHNSLVQEVVRQSTLRFKPDVPMIKKCIETLIDKQYIERTPNTRDEYVYIA
ncbi:hypothetical protein LSH36_1200g00010 [Paralvinella palmiformis]|uniref:Cullin-2 n=1 Tax=Paralvinella palmiformis TaxID=53620 RepID=A0AAD9IUT0_9ANNE|nr:hypothetical protein LSH36_1200g00010 [Paralvinella palmiformis]